MQIKVINMPDRKTPMEIYCIGDIHEGAANVNETAIKKAVKIIKDSGARTAISKINLERNPISVC